MEPRPALPEPAPHPARTSWAGCGPIGGATARCPRRIERLLRGDRRFGARDRRLYRELVYTAIRHLPWIEPPARAPDPDRGRARDRRGWPPTLPAHAAPSRRPLPPARLERAGAAPRRAAPAARLVRRPSARRPFGRSRRRGVLNSARPAVAASSGRRSGAGPRGVRRPGLGLAAEPAPARRHRDPRRRRDLDGDRGLPARAWSRSRTSAPS